MVGPDSGRANKFGGYLARVAESSALVNAWTPAEPPSGRPVVREANAFLPDNRKDCHIAVVVRGFSEESLATVTSLLETALIHRVSFERMAMIGGRRLAVFRLK